MGSSSLQLNDEPLHPPNLKPMYNIMHDPSCEAEGLGSNPSTVPGQGWHCYKELCIIIFRIKKGFVTSYNCIFVLHY